MGTMYKIIISIQYSNNLTMHACVKLQIYTERNQLLHHPCMILVFCFKGQLWPFNGKEKVFIFIVTLSNQLRNNTCSLPFVVVFKRSILICNLYTHHMLGLESTKAIVV